jgi:hypothetical protein
MPPAPMIENLIIAKYEGKKKLKDTQFTSGPS